MRWNIQYIKEAQRDLKQLDPYNRTLVVKAIEKTAEHPLPPPDRVGKPLNNYIASHLHGYYKIKLRKLGYRVIYELIIRETVMKIIVISIRDDNEVYKEAERRIRKKV